MSHDGTVVAVVPVLVIRMPDNQRCAAALESYQEAPELRVQGAGRAVVLKELRLKPDEARVCILLFSNVEGKLCLDRKLRCSTWRGSGRGGERARVLAVAKTTFLTAPRDLLYGGTATS